MPGFFNRVNIKRQFRNSDFGRAMQRRKFRNTQKNTAEKFLRETRPNLWQQLSRSNRKMVLNSQNPEDFAKIIQLSCMRDSNNVFATPNELFEDNGVLFSLKNPGNPNPLKLTDLANGLKKIRDKFPTISVEQLRKLGIYNHDTPVAFAVSVTNAISAENLNAFLESHASKADVLKALTWNAWIKDEPAIFELVCKNQNPEEFCRVLNFVKVKGNPHLTLEHAQKIAKKFKGKTALVNLYSAIRELNLKQPFKPDNWYSDALKDILLDNRDPHIFVIHGINKLLDNKAIAALSEQEFLSLVQAIASDNKKHPIIEIMNAISRSLVTNSPKFNPQSSGQPAFSTIDHPLSSSVNEALNKIYKQSCVDYCMKIVETQLRAANNGQAGAGQPALEVQINSARQKLSERPDLFEVASVLALLDTPENSRLLDYVPTIISSSAVIISPKEYVEALNSVAQSSVITNSNFRLIHAALAVHPKPEQLAALLIAISASKILVDKNLMDIIKAHPTEPDKIVSALEHLKQHLPGDGMFKKVPDDVAAQLAKPGGLDSALAPPKKIGAPPPPPSSKGAAITHAQELQTHRVNQPSASSSSSSSSPSVDTNRPDDPATRRPKKS